MLARLCKTCIPAALGLALLLVNAQWAYAHAILVEATPAARSTVGGPDLDIRLRFNSRIDGPRSRLTLVQPSGRVRALALQPQAAPEVLTAHAGALTHGAYKLRWQVLAADGHITRGDVPFQVK